MSDAQTPATPTAEDRGTPPGKRRALLIGLASVFVLAGVIWLALWYFVFSLRQSTDDAYVHGNQVNVAAAVPGTIVAIMADDTQLVRAGQPLVRLDRTDAELQLAGAKHALQQAVRGVAAQFAQVAQADAEVAARRAQLAQAVDTLHRSAPLLGQRAVSAEQVTQLRNAVRAARAALNAALLPGPVLGLLARAATQLTGATVTGDGWLWLTPISPRVASYAPLPILAVLLVVGALGVALLRPRRRAAVRRTVPWDCGFAPPTPRMQYSAAGFAQPQRRVFAPLYDPHEQVTPGRYELAVGDRAWRQLYLPLGTLTDRVADLARRMQAGHVRRYLAWSLITLLVLLWIVS